MLLQLMFPLAAVGMAAFAGANGWGLLDHFQVPFWLAVSVAVIVIVSDFVIWLQHVMVHAVPALWRLHQVHHSVEDDETNSNVGLNLPWWERLFGTYRAQPRAGHALMTLGVQGHLNPREAARLPFRDEVEGHAINRRHRPEGGVGYPTQDACR